MRMFRKNSLKMSGATLFVSMLFFLLMCSHNTLGAEQGCHVSEADLVCQDLCDCQEHDQQHQCALESLHSHEFCDDAPSPINFDLSQHVFVYATLLCEKPNRPFHYLNTLVRFSSHSFAVRHLDTIILRV